MSHKFLQSESIEQQSIYSSIQINTPSLCLVYRRNIKLNCWLVQVEYCQVIRYDFIDKEEVFSSSGKTE